MASYTVFGKREIEETLENFNQQQQRDDKERLEPVDQWSSTIIDKLKLTEDQDLLSVDAEVATSQILPTTDNEKTKEALRQFFFQYLNEVKYFRCIEHIKAILFEFLSDRNTKRKIELLKQRIEILKTMKPTLTGDELERSIRDLQNLHQFHQSMKELPDWCSLDFEFFDIFAALLKLSPALLPIREDLVQVFKEAGLLEYVFDKICISKITEIRCTDGLPAVSPALRMLSSLAVFDSRARNTIGGSTEVHDAIRPKEKEKVSWITLQKASSFAHAQKSNAKQLHPVDVLFASFLCCDAEVKQFLCQRLFQCKLAFPFLYANEFNELVQSDWILGDITLEFEGSDREPKRICLGSAFAMQIEKQSITDSLAPQQQAPVVDDTSTSTSNNKQLPVISFLRTGDLKVSKSQILSKLLSSETLDTHVFFHRECTNGKALRICSSGLVEAAVWFKKPVGDKHHNATPYLVLNLRGDAKKHDAQTEKMAKLSQCCVLFGGLDEFSKPETVQFVETLHHKAKKVLLFVLEPLKEVENRDAFQRYEELQLKTEFLFDPSVAEICSTVHSALDEILSPAGDFQQMPRVQEAVKLKDFPDFVMNSAREVFSHVMSGKFGRKNILALQSSAESHVHTDEKKVFRYFKLMAKLITSGKDPESVLAAQQTLYQSQVTAYETNGTFLANFVTQLHKLRRTKAVFVKISLFSLKFALDEHSFKQNEKLLQAEDNLKRCPDSDFNKKISLEERVEKAKKAYLEASIDLNCLLREVGLLFESHAQINETNMPHQIQRLPGIFASLLLSGMPIELLDGTLGNIPMKWISAVLLECKRQAGDKKIFVVSVLGIQSSGKSTLLNTMFGMRLPVSAGRCTRGAFLQLVHADQSSQLPFDYLAVIDTEGIMSVEDSSDNYFRDNEFATLVLGLADVTLITMNGEDSPEMRNVLPIVIKAFIQMMQVNKELGLKRHCIFTHQHVSEPTAGHRMQSGIAARQDKLEKFTKAESIKAGLGEKSFSDIISFSPESDVFLLPGLWLGNPPADPVNTVYSEKVQALKQHLIQLSRDPHVPLHSFEDFACRIEDIWNAVLTQNFVFSYRNSIEMKAFDELEEKFKKIALEFEEEVYEFSRKRFTSRESNIHSREDLDRSEKEIRDEMPKAIGSAFKEAEKKLNKYFQESERKEYISQHHCGRMSALVTKKDTLEQELQNRLREFVKVQNVRINQNAKIETVKKKLKGLADELNMTNQSQPISDEKIQDHFEKLWNTEVSAICEDSAVLSEPIEEIVRNCAMEALQSNQDCSWTAKITLKPSEPEKLTNLSEVMPHSSADELYQVRGLVRGLIDKGHSKYQNAVLDAVKCILSSIGPILRELSEKNRSFWKSDAEKVVKKVCCEFEKTSGRLSVQIGLMNKLKEALVVYACRLAYPTFKQMETRFSERFSLKSKLEEEKEQLLKIFKGHVSKLRHSIMAADDVLDALKKVLTRSFEETIDKIPGKCLEHLQKSIGNKAALIKKLLVHGIESDQQILCSYIRSPKQAADDFLKMQVQEVLFDKNGHDSLYILIIDAEFFEPSRNAIQNAFTAANEAKNDNKSVTGWLKEFCDICNEFEFPLSIEQLDASLLQGSEVDLTEFLESFTDKKVFELIESFFQEKTAKDRQDYNIPGMKKAYQDAISYFWGCDHCCPLCNEPCIRMEADHVTEDKASSKHRCIGHRPMGLTGEKLESRHEFAPYACGYFSTGISQSLIAKLFPGLRNKNFKCHKCSAEVDLSTTEEGDQEAAVAGTGRKERKLHHCCEYKKCFPDWDIEPTFWAPVPDYWKWIAWKYRDSLMETSKEYAQIPDAWKDITSEKALESLNKSFENNRFASTG
ncbi:hypothetical protein BOX15_Mlig012632g1 [Macrostomum lignano]|uniref:VLIG-type G domain-containing protein n=1 Tax=Macrostomum lignano TaxID=282301 RepID=A0A267G8A3_9PLAT|nr:hypothetical protein BOX15_Mlig012632g1 [Macrostomum lignano]